ncbi:MAG: FAD-dependent oxidoreductase [Sphingobium sp.]
MTDHSILFTPAAIGSLQLKNRIIKSPQTTALSHQDGTVSRRTVNHYKRLAEGGIGLVLVEYTYVDDFASKSIHAQVGASRREHIPGLGWLVDEVHAAGAKIGIQLEHCGRQRFLGTAPIRSSSAISWDYVESQYGERPQPMTLAEIEDVIAAFGDAAQRAFLARFDLVEVHAGHGYLITNFLSPHINKRTDEYGGSFENRIRLLMRIVADIRSKVPADFPLSIRVSVTDYEADGIPIEETVELCRRLEAAGVDVIHASGGHHALMEYEVSPWFMPRSLHRWGWEQIRDAVTIPVIGSGSIVSPDAAAEIIASGSADFVSLGRPMLADPDWARKAREGRAAEITPCIRCNDGCLHRGVNAGRSTGCAVNPSMGNEYSFPVEPAAVAQKIAVVGAGPAGMKAAITLADMGHEVTMFDPAPLGGQLIAATQLDLKQDLRALLTHLVHEIERRPVRLVGEEATVERLRKGGFERVILATGRRPLTLPFGEGWTSGMPSPEKVGAGDRALVIGGGMVGCDAALQLACAGAAVTLIEKSGRLLSDTDVFTDQGGLPGKLREQGIQVLTSAEAIAAEESGVLVRQADGEEQQLTAAIVVVAIGHQPDRSLHDRLQAEYPELPVDLVGTARSGGRVMDALHDAFFTARHSR